MSAQHFGPAIVRPWYIDARLRAVRRHRAARAAARHRAERAGEGWPPTPAYPTAEGGA